MTATDTRMNPWRVARATIDRVSSEARSAIAAASSWEDGIPVANEARAAAEVVRRSWLSAIRESETRVTAEMAEMAERDAARVGMAAYKGTVTVVWPAAWATDIAYAGPWMLFGGVVGFRLVQRQFIGAELRTWAERLHPEEIADRLTQAPSHYVWRDRPSAYFESPAVTAVFGRSGRVCDLADALVRRI